MKAFNDTHLIFAISLNEMAISWVGFGMYLTLYACNIGCASSFN